MFCSPFLKCATQPNKLKKCPRLLREAIIAKPKAIEAPDSISTEVHKSSSSECTETLCLQDLNAFDALSQQPVVRNEQTKDQTGSTSSLEFKSELKMTVLVHSTIL